MGKVYPAKVVNNNDPKQQGRVQVRIAHVHEKVSDEELPFAYPANLTMGCNDDMGESNIPDIGTNVDIEYKEGDEFRKTPYYTKGISFSDSHPHNLFEDEVKDNLESQGEYPDVKYTYYQNGICIGVDSSKYNPEIFLYHPMGFFHINRKGEIKIKTSEDENYQNVIKGNTLHELLDTLIEEIKAIQVPTAMGICPISPDNTANFITIQDELDTILWKDTLAANGNLLLKGNDKTLEEKEGRNRDDNSDLEDGGNEDDGNGTDNENNDDDDNDEPIEEEQEEETKDYIQIIKDGF